MNNNNLIACCGLDCAACDARIATINNDNALRQQIAEQWRVNYGNEAITAEMINCTGCREEGAKIGHCAECQIRSCAQGKGFDTCADCEQLENCETVGQLLKMAPKALENLRSIKA